MQQQRRLWRECAFIAEAYVGQTSRLRHGKHTLHTEERNVHLMWSRLNLPGSTSIRCRGSPHWGGGGNSGGEAVTFDSPLTVSYRLGWSRILQAVGCLTCQVNHRQPLSLLAPPLIPTTLSSAPPSFAFVVSRAPLRYPQFLPSVLIRDIMLQ